MLQGAQKKEEVEPDSTIENKKSNMMSHYSGQFNNKMVKLSSQPEMSLTLCAIQVDSWTKLLYFTCCVPGVYFIYYASSSVSVWQSMLQNRDAKKFPFGLCQLI